MLLASIVAAIRGGQMKILVINSKRRYLYTCIISFALLLGACTNMPGGEVSTSPNYAFEIVPADEAEQILDIAAKTAELQRMRQDFFSEDQGGKILRGVHPKSHGCVVADFNVSPNIAAELQVGLFAKPGSNYKALIRFSNASVRLTPDLEKGEDGKLANGSRGMAVKVFDVGDNVLIGDVNRSNQDFLMINTRAFAFPNVRSYLRLTDALLSDPSGADPRSAFKPAEDWSAEDMANLRKTGGVLEQIRAKTVRNPIEVQYFGAAPSSFGDDRVMKFSAEPCGGEKPQEPFDALPGDNYLHDALLASIAIEQVCFDFKIQVLGVDQVREDRNGNTGENTDDLIEDATRVWGENEFPFTKVAQIIIPVSSGSNDSVLQDCEARAFNPWHSLTDHQPLGGINRLRKPVYVISEVTRRDKP